MCGEIVQCCCLRLDSFRLIPESGGVTNVKLLLYKVKDEYVTKVSIFQIH